MNKVGYNAVMKSSTVMSLSWWVVAERLKDAFVRSLGKLTWMASRALPNMISFETFDCSKHGMLGNRN
jgi:hypothetical protein